MMTLLSFFLLLAVLFSADAAKFRRLRGENSVNNKYLDLASEVDETVLQRTRQLMKGKINEGEGPAPGPDREPDMSMSLSMSMSMSMSMSISMSMPMSMSMSM
jgi:hypothetical protein